MVKTENFSPKMKNKTGTQYPLLPFNVVLEVQSIRQEKEKSGHSSWAGRSKIISVFRWYDLTYKSPKNPSNKKKVLELINKFNKVAGYKINT